jgi:endonuclease/exonuclease/phosphatase family metal-dependent hydrolase
MKTKLLLVAIFLIFYLGAWHFGKLRSISTSSEFASFTEAGAFTLLTWNIGYFDYEADTRAQDQDLKHIAAVIADAAPDIAALQEIARPEQVVILNEGLQGYYPHHALARGFRTDRFVAFLSKSPLVDEARVATSVGREALAVTFELPKQKRNVTLVNCHADAFSARRRRFFISDVIDWHRSSAKQNVVLAGDFNLDLAPVESSDLFTDDKKNDSESYSLILEDFRDVGRNAGPTSVFDRRIDYVFLASRELAAADFKVLRGKLVGKMDHNPLLVRFRWNR